jgi:DNA helicase II / ATP-dependent DNA helicase PcrA
MPTLNPTVEQQAIITAATTTSDNLMLNALAGTGKSSTLKMIDRAIKTKPALYLVFNRRNADEATASGEFADTTTIRTFNSLGHRIWAAYCAGKVVLDARKTNTLFKEAVDALTKAEAKVWWSYYQVVADGVSKAKAIGYVPEGVYPAAKRLAKIDALHNAMDEPPDEHAAEIIDAILTESIKRAYKGLIDYNDQIYMPALFGGAYPRFPLVLVDEYQDQSPVNHALLARLVKGRVIGVGDPWQNIYGFRGAKADGMTQAAETYSMTSLDLSVSFRCPQAIVEAARWRVPHFKWLKQGGHVEEAGTFKGADFPDDATIICRNNAPLLRLAFRLLSCGKSVSVMGSDIGPRLIGIMKKFGNESMKREAVFAAIEDYREAKVLAGSKSAADLADCMRVFADHGDTLGTAISYAEHLFKQTGTIRLLTGHKSKGLEFENVFFLDPWLLSDSEQDKNLRYVIITRSQNSLVMLDSKAIVW